MQIGKNNDMIQNIQARLTQGVSQGVLYLRRIQFKNRYVTLSLALLAGILFGVFTSENSLTFPFWSTTSKSYFIPLEPTLLVRVMSEDKTTHHAMIDVVLMTHDPRQVSEIRKNANKIRSNIIELIQGSTYRRLSSIEGKKQLREDALLITNEMLHESESEDSEGTVVSNETTVDGLLFTNYLVE